MTVTVEREGINRWRRGGGGVAGCQMVGYGADPLKSPAASAEKDSVS